MIEAELEALRQQLSAVRDGKPAGRRYPETLRQAVQAYGRRRLAAGVGVEALGRELGLAWGTLHRWLGEPTGLAPAPGGTAFRAVVVAKRSSCSPSASFSLCSPGGYRVEGLGLEHVVYLLRELS